MPPPGPAIPDPDDEPARLADLHACGALDTQREAVFDRLVFTVAQLMRTPMAALTLVDSDRVWVKAAVGLTGRGGRRETCMCNVVLRGNALVATEDAAGDPRFGALPAVTGPLGIRFFVGAPVHGPAGYAVGVLCVLDQFPRSISDRQRAHVLQLAREGSDLLRQRMIGPEPLDRQRP